MVVLLALVQQLNLIQHLYSVPRKRVFVVLPTEDTSMVVQQQIFVLSEMYIEFLESIHIIGDALA